MERFQTTRLGWMMTKTAIATLRALTKQRRWKDFGLHDLDEWCLNAWRIKATRMNEARPWWRLWWQRCDHDTTCTYYWETTSIQQVFAYIRTTSTTTAMTTKRVLFNWLGDDNDGDCDTTCTYFLMLLVYIGTSNDNEDTTFTCLHRYEQASFIHPGRVAYLCKQVTVVSSFSFASE